MKTKLLLLTGLLGVTFIGLFLALSLSSRQKSIDPRTKARETAEKTMPVPTRPVKIRIEELGEKALVMRTESGAVQNRQGMNELAVVLQERKKLLTNLLETDPQSLPAFVWNNEVRDSFPEEVRDDIEENVDLTGNLQAVFSDNFQENISRDEIQFQSLDGRSYKIISPGGLEKDKLDGEVNIKGTVFEDTILSDSAGITKNSVKEVKGTADPLTLKIALVFFKFNNTEFYNPVIPMNKKMVWSQLYPDFPENTVKTYYREISGEKVIITGNENIDIYPPLSGDLNSNEIWYTVNSPAPLSSPTYSQVTAWRDEATRSAALQHSYVNSAYNRVIAVFPVPENPDPAKNYGGWSGLTGGSSIFLNQWIVKDTTPPIRKIAHEIGHSINFIHHADAYNCFDVSGVRTAISDNCTSATVSYQGQNIWGYYMDPFDIMGNVNGNARHFSTVHKNELGVMPYANTKTIESSGTYNIPIYWMEKPLPETQTLRLPRTYASGGYPLEYFYIEYRRPCDQSKGCIFGYDNFSAIDPVVNGVTIRLGYDYNWFAPTKLIDTTPETLSFSDASLGLGKSLFDPVSRTTISVTSLNDTYAQVEVKIDNPAIPTATKAPVPTVTRIPISTPTVSPVVQPTVPGGDITGPVITLSRWVDGVAYTSKKTVRISASAKDDSGVSQMQIFLDDSVAPMKTCSTNKCSVSFSASTVSIGAHKIRITAKDRLGNSSSMEVRFSRV